MHAGLGTPMAESPGAGGGSPPVAEATLRPFTAPLERQPSAAVADGGNGKRPLTSFPSTGLDAELQRLESDDDILRQMAMSNIIALAKHGGSTERVVQILIEKLQDSDKLFRVLAVQALQSRSARHVRTEVTSALIQSLKDADPNVRCRAVTALRPACIGASHARVVEALLGMLSDTSAFVQDAAVDNLTYAIPRASFTVREELLASVHKGIRAAAIDSFNEEVQGGSDQALDLVIGMLQDQEFQVRMSAIRVISALLTTRDATAEADRNAQLKTEGKMDHEYVQFPVSRCSASV